MDNNPMNMSTNVTGNNEAVKMAEARKAAYEEEQKRIKAERLVKFKILALPTLIFAIVATILLYKAHGGITTPLFGVATVAYVLYVTKELNQKAKRGIWLYAAGMIFFGVSDVYTANTVIQFFNNLTIYVLLVGMVLYIYHEETGWSISKYVGSFFIAVFGAVGAIGDLFGDTIEYSRNHQKPKSKNGLYILIGVLIFIPIGGIILALLSSADVVFNSMLSGFWGKINLSEDVIGIPCFLFCIYAAAYCGIRFVDKKQITEESKDFRQLPVLVANTVLSLISVIYLLFSFIQIGSLFLGKMSLPKGYTYAEYARQGFFQLLFVCILNLVIVLVIKGIFKPHISTNVLLTIITVCTYIMLASSALRMVMYIQVYNLTTLRVLVLWALAVIAVALFAIIVSVYKESFPLMHTLLAVWVVMFLFLGFAKPHAIVAKYNVEHYNRQLDVTYLMSLSEDAAPYLKELPERYQIEQYTDIFVSSLSYDHRYKTGIRNFNLSRYWAYTIYAEELEKYEAKITW